MTRYFEFRDDGDRWIEPYEGNEPSVPGGILLDGDRVWVCAREVSPREYAAWCADRRVAHPAPVWRVQ